MKTNFCRFILFFGISFLLVAPSFGAPIEATYDSITEKTLFTPATFGQSDFFDAPFSLTNNTGEVWTDFHLRLGSGECLVAQACNIEIKPIFIDFNLGGFDGTAYEGPGTFTVSPGRSIIDIVSLNIPVGGKLAFTLDVNYGALQDYLGTILGTPTTDGSTPPPVSTPEPGTLLLLGSGLIGLIGYRKIMF